jgi:hypothetical protein
MQGASRTPDVDDISTSVRSANLRDAEHQPQGGPNEHKRGGLEPAAIDPGADRQLKAKHRALWASGDYPAVSAELIPTLGPELVRASGVRAGDRVLDVAAGSGNAAIAAAAAGAIVTASDLTPELFARSAHRRGTWGRGGMGGGRRGGVVVCGQRFRRRDVVRGSDVRAAPPGHRRRVTPSVPARGTIEMINWTPQGFIGGLFATTQPYAPPAPPGANRRRCGATRVMSGNCWGRGSLGCKCGERRSSWTTAPTRRNPANIGSETTGRRSRSDRFNEDRPERVDDLDRDLLSLLTTWSSRRRGRPHRVRCRVPTDHRDQAMKSVSSRLSSRTRLPCK